jgi:putative membrane-bound dehydrogenase-like protein
MIRRLALIVALLPLPAFGLDGDDDLARELPRIKPTETAEALKTFRLHEGFALSVVADEPLVTDPVAACYDEEGRLYVVEMRGYPYPEDVPTGRVRRLEDWDGDGRYEASTVFLDGLSWPTGIVPHDGGVFVSVAPDILYAKDEDGDGKADTRKVMFTGFGNSNVQALLNGLLWGPDGWIYGASGGNGGDVKNLTRPDAPAVSVRGRDFQFRPDGSAFEATSGGGQFGHTFDDWGHRFVCNNSNHIRQVVLPSRYLERNPHLVAPAVVVDIPAEGAAAPVFRISAPEPWRIVRTRQRAADPEFVKRAPKTELVATGFFTSATGVTIYRGTAFPPEYRGNAFMGDVGGNLVHRKRMVEDGPIYKAVRADEGVEFLASTDNWFRPVNFANTPDGTLLILDMYRETIEHPWSIPEPIKKHLDLTSGHDRGRLYELIPAGFARPARKSLARESTAELVAHLGDPDAWWRETAQRLLIQKGGDEAVPALREMARSDARPLARVHAMWTLGALGRLDYEDVIPSLTHEHPRVREQAARMVEPFVKADPGRLGPLARLADDPDAMVRFQAAFSLGEAPGDEPLAALARIAGRDGSNPWTRTAVLSSIAGRVGPFAERLGAAGLLGKPEGRAWLGELAELVGAENRPEASTAFLARFAGPEADESGARAVVLGLGRGLQRAGGSLRGLLDGPAGATLRPLLTQAAEAASGDGSASTRVEAVRLIGLGRADAAVHVLPPLLDARQPAPVQLAALQALAALPDPRVGIEIVRKWSALSPSLRREAVEALLSRGDRAETLLDAVESGTIGRGDLEPARVKQLLDLPDQALRERARALLGASAPSNRGDVIGAYRKALDLSADASRGREVFRKQCATCHRAEGVGFEIGPNLATVTNRTPEDLIVHVLDPNREVNPTYQNYNVATTDGRVLTGLIADESATSVTLRRAEGAQDVLARSQIEEMAGTGLSLMPEGLEKEVDVQGMADLVAYLRSIGAGSPGTR